MALVGQPHKGRLRHHHHQEVPVVAAVAAAAVVVYTHNFHKHQAPRVPQALQMVQMFRLHRSLAQIRATPIQTNRIQTPATQTIQIQVTPANQIQIIQIPAIQVVPTQVNQIQANSQIIILATIQMPGIAIHNQTHTIPMAIAIEIHPAAEILTVATKTKMTIQVHSVIYSVISSEAAAAVPVVHAMVVVEALVDPAMVTSSMPCLVAAVAAAVVVAAQVNPQ